MQFAQTLPKPLANQYHNWQTTEFSARRELFTKLVDEGQSPATMVISCCDSRVHSTSVFGADAGDFFIHRNVASLVPANVPDQERNCTSAAVQYAVENLQVSRIMVLGHQKCGGVQGCHAMCSGAAPQFEEDGSFVGRWIDILRPGYARVVAKTSDPEQQVALLEREAVLLSLENLMTYSFVSDRVRSGALDLHGLWIDIREGALEQYDPAQGSFVPV